MIRKQKPAKRIDGSFEAACDVCRTRGDNRRDEFQGFCDGLLSESRVQSQEQIVHGGGVRHLLDAMAQ